MIITIFKDELSYSIKSSTKLYLTLIKLVELGSI